MAARMSTTLASPARVSSRTILLALLFTGFILIGIPTVIIGPILPVFISRWALDDSQAGFFFTVQFAASLCGVWIATALSSWRGYRPPLVIGYVLTGIGLSLLNAPTHVLALVATACFGVGYGMVTPPTNLSAAEAGGERSAGLVSLLNFAWGIGAVACSPLILLALRHQFLSSLLLSLGVCGFVLGGALLFAVFPAEKPVPPTNASGSQLSASAISLLAAIAALFFIYVGTETSIGGWAAEHAKRLAGHTTSLSTVAPMFFYAGLMSGRALAPVILRYLRERRVALISLALAATGVGLVIAAATQPLAIAGLALAGLGCASLYPLYISWFSKWYGVAARRLGGIVFSMASLGGSALPWLVGVTSKHTGSLRIGLLIPFSSAIAMICILLLLRRRTAE
jgi:FHS family glucose/mannose:H+ symporter-like MFS transporter